MDARIKPGHDESAAASMEHLLAAREQRSDLFDGEINFQIQIDLAELRRSKLRISSNPGLCVGQGNLVLADPLSLLFKVEQRRGIRNSGVIFGRREPALCENLTHLDSGLRIQVADEQDARTVRTGPRIEFLRSQIELVLAAAMVAHQRD